MRFDEECKVIIESLKVNEAEAFIKFLESEIIRHKKDIEQADLLIHRVKRMFRIQ